MEAYLDDLHLYQYDIESAQPSPLSTTTIPDVNIEDVCLETIEEPLQPSTFEWVINVGLETVRIELRAQERVQTHPYGVQFVTTFVIDATPEEFHHTSYSQFAEKEFVYGGTEYVLELQIKHGGILGRVVKGPHTNHWFQ